MGETQSNFFVGFAPLDLNNVPSKSYDLVLCNSVFQYFSKEDEAHSTTLEMLRICKDDGKVIIADVVDKAFREETEERMKRHWGPIYGESLPEYLYFSKDWWSRFSHEPFSFKVSVRNSKVRDYWRWRLRYIVELQHCSSK